jgi:hypothetical protein
MGAHGKIVIDGVEYINLQTSKIYLHYYVIWIIMSVN